MTTELSSHKLLETGLLENMTAEKSLVENAIAYEFITKSCYVDNDKDPQQAILILPFIAFLFGDAELKDSNELLELIPEKVDIYAQSQGWIDRLHTHFGEKLVKKRTSQFMRDFPTSLDGIKLQQKELPDGFTLRKALPDDIEKMKSELNSHIPMLFGDIETFLKHGIGYCILDNDTPISFASSFLPYGDTLEVVIATVDSDKYRRKGFATQTALALLAYCLEHNIKPFWGAMNEPSLKLALKLGYSNPSPYDVYGWRNA